MNKTVCDRCGKDVRNTIYGILSKRVSLHLGGLYVDLCDECRCELTNWMKERKIKK